MLASLYLGTGKLEEELVSDSSLYAHNILKLEEELVRDSSLYAHNLLKLMLT